MKDTKRKPNFFIIGAPKAGTTSLAGWLSEHPDIFMSTPKEPGYFNTEQPKRLIRSLKDYERLFVSAPASSRVLGEASTGYLSSNCAVQNILDYNSDAKFLVSLRNPLELVPSLHAEYIKAGRQWSRSLEAAWHAQQHPAKPLPVHANNYGRLCLLGLQMQRLLSLVPAPQVKIIWTEDLKHDPAQAYDGILMFLGLPNDARTDFPALNTRTIPISRSLAMASGLARRMLYRAGLASTFRSIGKRILFANAKPAEATPSASLTPSFRKELQEYFAEDIQILGELTGRDLSTWLR